MKSFNFFKVTNEDVTSVLESGSSGLMKKLNCFRELHPSLSICWSCRPRMMLPMISSHMEMLEKLEMILIVNCLKIIYACFAMNKWRMISWRCFPRMPWAWQTSIYSKRLRLSHRWRGAQAVVEAQVHLVGISVF
jgi:hypothetical protein